MPYFTTNDPGDYFAIGIQTAKGAEATSFVFVRHAAGTGMDTAQDVQKLREGGDGQDYGFAYKSMIKMDGSAQGNARGEFTNLAVAAVMGKTASVLTAGSGAASALATGLQRFDYVPNATLPYLTGEQKAVGVIERAADLKAAGLTVTGEAGAPISLQLDILSAGTQYERPLASALTATREAADPVFFARGVYVLEGSSTVGAKLTKFTYAVKRNLDDSVQTTDLFRDDLPELTRDYDFDATLKYESATFYQKVQRLGGSTVPLQLATGAINLAMTNQLGQGSANYRALAIDSPVCYVDAKLNRLDPDGKTVYLDVTGFGYPGSTLSPLISVTAASRAALV